MLIKTCFCGFEKVSYLLMPKSQRSEGADVDVTFQSIGMRDGQVSPSPLCHRHCKYSLKESKICIQVFFIFLYIRN